jgi:hypothetical protein
MIMIVELKRRRMMRAMGRALLTMMEQSSVISNF